MGLTVGEIEEYMVRKGYRSKYSTADLENEYIVVVPPRAAYFHSASEGSLYFFIHSCIP